MLASGPGAEPAPADEARTPVALPPALAAAAPPLAGAAPALAGAAPALATAVAALAGLVNVAAVAMPGLSWDGRRLLAIAPIAAIRSLHALALPAGAALLILAPYLLRRRRRAWRLAVVLTLTLGSIDLIGGPEPVAASVSFALAALLLGGRRAFGAEHDPVTLSSAVWRICAVGIAGLGLATVAAWLSGGRPPWVRAVRETVDLVGWHAGPLRFERHLILHHAIVWVPLAVHALALATLLAIAWALFRPLAAVERAPGAEARRVAERLVREHGTDTLSFFKLRSDTSWLFSADRRAFAAYRIESGVLLLSGDPVGPDDALAPLIEDVRRLAALHGLRLGAVGASERLAPLYRRMGLSTMYIGDEAIVELDRFSLEGRPIRKVRQSVTRLRRAGYVSELSRVCELDALTAAEVDEVLELGRAGAPERGFSMAMDAIRGDHDSQTLVLLARDGTGRVRGVLHFVPCYGRAAVSLSFMRRDPGTPNGLTEFMVCEAASALRQRGLSEMSLNFAAFARWIHSPAGLAQRLLGRLVALANPFFQIESLYRFNSKFFPRWQPRHLVFEGPGALPRTCLAAMWAEGQLPKPRLPSPLRRPGRRRASGAAAVA
ncbi:MAG TPA: phosphatidylglycerol lysyltransferase domain-containing protein [Solirubrobacteraceae bacterium]|nr:phosphatidylglycerol lysyltransferase domain-containing protein [Solirubrobacteraceae bacterium]